MVNFWFFLKELYEMLTKKASTKEAKRLHNRLTVCSSCKQVLIMADAEHHTKQHEVGETI